jgi:integrase
MTALAATATGKCREHLLWTRTARRLPPSPRVDRSRTAACSGLAGHLAGANPKVVQRMLGHASAATPLDVYADLFECDLDAVAESVSKMCRRWV